MSEDKMELATVALSMPQADLYRTALENRYTGEGVDVKALTFGELVKLAVTEIVNTQIAEDSEEADRRDWPERARLQAVSDALQGLIDHCDAVFKDDTIHDALKWAKKVLYDDPKKRDAMTLWAARERVRNGIAEKVMDRPPVRCYTTTTLVTDFLRLSRPVEGSDQENRISLAILKGSRAVEDYCGRSWGKGLVGGAVPEMVTIAATRWAACLYQNGLDTPLVPADIPHLIDRYIAGA